MCTLLLPNVVVVVAATLEFGRKWWLLRLEALQTYDQSDVLAKRREHKLTKIWKDKGRNTKRQRQRPKSDINWSYQGSFTLLRYFYIFFRRGMFQVLSIVNDGWHSVFFHWGQHFCRIWPKSTSAESCPKLTNPQVVAACKIIVWGWVT